MSRGDRPRVVWHVLGLVLGALYLVPMAYVIMVALTPDGQEIGRLPSSVTIANVGQGFASAAFPVFLVNSIVVTVVATIIQVALSAAAGYGLAKLPVRGSRQLTLLLVGLLVVPPEVVMVPLFVMVSRIPLVGGNGVTGQGGHGLLDTVPGLVVPHLVSALGIFLMRQFYRDLPDELGDAARVDGAGEIGIFARIYTPLVMPAVAVVAIFAFQGAWNDFLWPLVMTRSVGHQTVQLGLTVFFQENSTQWNRLMAVVVVISIPVVLLFGFAQRSFRSDVMSGAVK